MYKITITCNKPSPRITLSKIAPGQSLLEVSIDHNLGLTHECGGMAICGTCSVKILSGEEFVEFQSRREIHTLTKKGKDPSQLRLACQCVILEGSGEIEFEFPEI